MKDFLRRFGSSVVGVLQGFDRLRFRGSKRQLCHVTGMMSWLGAMGILLRDYKVWVKDTSVTLCRAIEEKAAEEGLYRFLNNCQESKEQTALAMAAEQGRTQGLIAVLGCVEPCQAIQVRGNSRTKKLEVRVETGKCKHYYHYYLDPRYGLRYTQAAKVTRQLRLLRGHGVIAKIAKTHRYQLTDKGRTSLAALLAARRASTK